MRSKNYAILTGLKIRHFLFKNSSSPLCFYNFEISSVHCKVVIYKLIYASLWLKMLSQVASAWVLACMVPHHTAW